MEKSLRYFIDTYQREVEPLEREKHTAYFDAAVTGDIKHYKQYEVLEKKHASILSNKDAYGFLSAAIKRDAVDDLLLKRQVKVLHHIFQAHQIPDHIQKEMIELETMVANKFSLFRAEVDGKRLTDNQIEEILESSADSTEVKSAWDASKMVGSLVEEDVRRLVTLRNEAARLLGYDDYHQMSLQLSELDPAVVQNLFDRLDAITKKDFQREKDAIDVFLAEKFGIDVMALRPWHYQDRFFQEASQVDSLPLDEWYAGQDLASLTADFFGGIGLPVDDIIKSSDLFEKPGKNQHAFCIHIDRYGDVRVLCNIKPKWKWMNTMLHEYGHAVYEKYYADDLPFVLREPAHIFATEAVAMFFGRLASDPFWMADMGIIGEEDASRFANKAQRKLRREQLVFSRWAQVMYRFEKAMYGNPEQDLNALWWFLVEKYQGLTPPEDKHIPHWASKIHVATAPCYYHNYLLGELLASQFDAWLADKVAGPGKGGRHRYVSNTQIGDFFRDRVFAPGARLPWNEMITAATGGALDPRYYAEQFTTEQ
ncbi:MAG: peptidase M3 [Bacteroidia bacterium]|nr:MAG: peptidase M3 [Bacteroidia bacterium]